MDQHYSSPKHSLLLLLLLTVLLAISLSHALAQIDESSLKITTDLWPNGFSFYNEQIGDEEEIRAEEEEASSTNRRSLLWGKAIHYYISYGALSANRIPCPPRSGRSYYTHNCYRARGPVHPYTRGCSAITRCRR